LFLESSYDTTPGDEFEEPDLDLRIDKDSTLHDALKRLVSESDGLLAQTEIGKVIVLAPPATRGTTSVLDTIIDLSLNDVSTWEALLEVVRRVNEKLEGRDLLSLDPDFVGHGISPPLEFMESTVHLELNRITAREALCSLMAHSPVPLSMRYSNRWFSKDDEVYLNAVLTVEVSK